MEYLQIAKFEFIIIVRVSYIWLNYVLILTALIFNSGYALSTFCQFGFVTTVMFNIAIDISFIVCLHCRCLKTPFQSGQI